MTDPQSDIGRQVKSLRRPWLGMACALGVACVLVIACGSDKAAPGKDSVNGPSGMGLCDHPNPGCPCSVAGQAANCGSVESRTGNVVLCLEGTTTCDGSKWGSCNTVGGEVKTRVVEGGQLHFTALGTPGPCGAADACDPYCNQIVDTPPGIAGGSICGGGLCIGGGGGGGCLAATDWKQYYAQYPAAGAPNGSPIANTCSGGPPDNCSNDLKCTAGNCLARAPGDSGTCAGIDFTLSTPCYDGTRHTFMVCNRGTVAATSGILPIAHHNGSASTPARTCTIAANGPAGDCFIDLAAKPLQPGSCVQFTPTVDCAANVPNDSGDQFYFVNQTNIGSPLIAGECDSCNNFTATKDTAKPPGVPGAACTPSYCALPGGGGGSTLIDTTANGDSACAPASNVHSVGCALATQLTDCEQDFRCDPTSLTCVWNGGPGWFDATAAGVDLTVGAACTQGAFPGPAVVPICNRGTGTVAAGTSIGINVTNPPGAPAGCTAIGPPDCSAPAPVGGLGPGQCMDISGCPSLVPGNKFTVVNAGQRDVPEPGGRCANNSAWAKTAGGCAICGKCDTRLSGKVYDPSGPAGNNLPLANIDVFEAAGALIALPAANGCDSCASLQSPFVARAVTDATGSFALSGLSPGPNVPIVVQSGRWRRQVNMAITACVNNPVPAAAPLRMPRNRTDGLGGVADIPKTAIVSGNQESLECLLVKIGITPAEIMGRQTAADANRFQDWHLNGMQTSPAAADVAGLYAALPEYSQVIWNCDGGDYTNDTSQFTAAFKAQLKTYGDNGGHVFLDHYPGEAIRKGPALNSGATVTTWQDADSIDSTAKAHVSTTTIPQKTFHDWLANVGVTSLGPSGWVKISTPRKHALIPGAAAIYWMEGRDGDSWGGGAPPGNPTNPPDHAFSLSFDTPVGAANCGTPNGHGRFLYNAMHVSPSRCNGDACGAGTFPTDCTNGGGLAEDEKALEYQLFQLGACQIGGNPPPPPPPPPPPLASITLTRDYNAVCAPGLCVQWGYFSWQSIVPFGTSVDFSGQTAVDVAGAPGAYGPSVPIGSANTTTASWTWDACSVDGHLHNYAQPPQSIAACVGVNPPQRSLPWLRVSMKFNPSGAVSPIISSWRQMYDCTPCE